MDRDFRPGHLASVLRLTGDNNAGNVRRPCREGAAMPRARHLSFPVFANAFSIIAGATPASARARVALNT